MNDNEEISTLDDELRVTKRRLLRVLVLLAYALLVITVFLVVNCAVVDWIGQQYP